MNNKLIKKQNLIYRLKSNNERLIGLYIGIWAGDGSQYYDNGYRVKICCHSENKILVDFYKFVLKELFGKTVTHFSNDKGYRAVLRFNSKFIYHFVDDYLIFEKPKTYSVHLKQNVNSYSQEFLEGFILGSTLTDGYIKEKYQFNVTSKKFALNVLEILKKWNLKPSLYIHDRAKYNWNDLYMVRLNVNETNKLKLKLNRILLKIGCKISISNLKYNK